MLINADTATYQLVKECLGTQFPGISVQIISSDPMLKKLGFSTSVPCTFEIMATDEQIKEILDYALYIEERDYDSGDPSEYQKWTKVYDILFYYS